MNIKAIQVVVLIGLITSGCTNRQIYESIQPKYTEVECMANNLPKTKHEECIQQESTSYEQYEKERQKILKKSSR